jgi:hypothetical protein
MREADELNALLSQWVEKAEGDLRNAAHTLKLGRRCPTETVAFHAQQCVEKYIKAALLSRGVKSGKSNTPRPKRGGRGKPRPSRRSEKGRGK